MSHRTYVKRNAALGDVYSYDTADQLTGVQYNCNNPDTTPTSPSQTTSYTYDAAGNRTQVVDSINGTTNYTPNSDNQYTVAGGNAATYDGRGNLATFNGWTYTYDAHNLLIQATDTMSDAALIPILATIPTMAGLPLQIPFDFLGKLWNFPNTLIGLIIGGVEFIAGEVLGTDPQVNFGDNSIQFTNLPWGEPGGALTLGNVQLYDQLDPSQEVPTYAGDSLVIVGQHEEGYTWQSQALGVFFLPVYFFSGGISAQNPFEQAADLCGSDRGGYWPQ